MSNSLQPTTYAQVKAMIDEYTANLWQVSTNLLALKYPDRPGIQEAKSSWVSRSDINALLDDNNANGLRIYYGVHDQSTLPISTPFDYLGLHTVILVATVDSVDPQNPAMENSVDQLDQDPGQPDGTFKGMAGDIVPLCPPNCPPTSIF